ncbi:MAG: hypothetical protein ABI321_14680 [Polyangia bacterium]
MKRLDARLFVLGNNLLLLGFGLVLFALQRSAAQIVSSIGAAIAVELLFSVRKLRAAPDVRALVKDRVLSASVAGVSLLILLRSTEPWFYPAVAALAITSKYVLRTPRGHLFNPTNFAIVAALALVPDSLQVRPDQFSSSPWLMVMTVAFGVAATSVGAVWRCTAGYYATVLLVGLPVGTLLLHVKPLWILVPELNTSTLIFAFLMITDPRTTPRGHRSQLLFGGLVALVHLWMRSQQLVYSPFIALFVVTALRSAKTPGRPE